jgi:hypothetical protein
VAVGVRVRVRVGVEGSRGRGRRGQSGRRGGQHREAATEVLRVVVTLHDGTFCLC